MLRLFPPPVRVCVGLVIQNHDNMQHNKQPHIRPRLLYLQSVLFNIVAKGWRNGTFLTVQWRTETATGKLVTCYRQVREMVDEFREKEGYERRQVFFNTDMPAGASGTYVRQDSTDTFLAFGQEIKSTLGSELRWQPCVAGFTGVDAVYSVNYLLLFEINPLLLLLCM